MLNLPDASSVHAMAAPLQGAYLEEQQRPPLTSPQAHSLIFPKSLGVEKLYSKLQWPIIQCIYQFPVIWRFTLKKKKKKSRAINVVSKIENISEHKAYSSSFRTNTTSILVDAQTDGFQRLYIRVYETKPSVFM